MLPMVNEDKSTFGIWLKRELERRRMNQADLSRASVLAGGYVSTAQISRIISGNDAGQKALLDIARALSLPPEQLFRLAGILPPEGKADTEIEEALHILQKLGGLHRREALRQLHLRLEVQEEEAKSNAKGKKRNL